MELTLVQVFGILALTGLLIAVLGTVIAVYSLIEVKSIQRSTHSIQYMPVDDAIDKENQEFIKSLQTKKEEWATTEESLNKQRKLFKEDVENVMPEFAEDDEPEILSF
jgi:predicted Holliday junction resolvase-like endonuclease